jgi:hypothetical protein
VARGTVLSAKLECADVLPKGVYKLAVNRGVKLGRERLSAHSTVKFFLNLRC